jgi:hypothetical protein
MCAGSHRVAGELEAGYDLCLKAAPRREFDLDVVYAQTTEGSADEEMRININI